MSFGDEKRTELERIADLERQCRFLALRLGEAEALLESQALLIEELQDS